MDTQDAFSFMDRRMAKLRVELQRLADNYPLLVVIGGCWGDEGKGKIVDLLMEKYGTSVRFGGGCNAGHTIYDQYGNKSVTHLLPVGAIRGKDSYCARGEYIDFAALDRELAMLAEKDISPNYYIDFGAQVFTSWHLIWERYLELQKGNNKVDTTSKGIVGYELMVNMRTPITVGQAVSMDHAQLSEYLRVPYNVLAPIVAWMRKRGEKVQYDTPEEVATTLIALAAKHKEQIVDVSAHLDELAYEVLDNIVTETPAEGIIFEGAQAGGLDKMWGTTPFTSVGLSLASGAAQGTGIAPSLFSGSLLVTKIFPTRVGAGPFPSELGTREDASEFPKRHAEFFRPGIPRETYLDDTLRFLWYYPRDTKVLAKYIQALGMELGATTGRGRSVGAFDLVWLLYMCCLNRPIGIALNRFDLLSGLREIPVVTKWFLDDKEIAYGTIPQAHQIEDVRVQIDWFPGWNDDISNCQNYADLPKAAQALIEMIESSLSQPVVILGVGPRRDQAIVRSLGI